MTKITAEQAAAIGKTIADALKAMVDGTTAPLMPGGITRTTPGLEKFDKGAPRLVGKNGDASAGTSAEGADFERLYLAIKNRLLDELIVDPIMVKLLASRPEIIIDIEPRIVQLDGSSVKGRVARLMAAGWFATARATSAVRRELARTGADPGGGGTLSDILSGYVRDGFLIREGEGYAFAPGVKVTERELTAK